MLNILRNDQTLFPSSCTILHSRQRCARVPISPQRAQHLLFSFFFIIAILGVGKWYLIVGFCLFVCFVFSMATSTAYGGSQARSPIAAVAYARATAMPDQAASETYSTAHGNSRSLTHWSSPGIEPATPRFLIGFVSTAPQQELLVVVLTCVSLTMASIFSCAYLSYVYLLWRNVYLSIF